MSVKCESIHPKHIHDLRVIENVDNDLARSVYGGKVTGRNDREVSLSSGKLSREILEDNMATVTGRGLTLSEE